MLPYVLRLSHFILFYLRKKAVEKLATSAHTDITWKGEEKKRKTGTVCVEKGKGSGKGADQVYRSGDHSTLIAAFVPRPHHACVRYSNR
jgi:hypothetical protein